ncbi:MAG: hypothetical protein ACYSUP_14710 [Planctomycetota bacterium]|jgi:hypothetical protein
MSNVRPFANEKCCAAVNDAPMLCAGVSQRDLWSGRLDGSENGHLRVRRRRESRRQGFVGCGVNTVLLEDYG